MGERVGVGGEGGTGREGKEGREGDDTQIGRVNVNYQCQLSYRATIRVFPKS